MGASALKSRAGPLCNAAASKQTALGLTFVAMQIDEGDVEIPDA